MKTATKTIDLVEDYINHRRSLGFGVSDSKDGAMLRSLGYYADRAKHAGPLTVALAVGWATSTSKATPIQSARRLALARGFARYRKLFDPCTEVPPEGMLGPARYPRRAPHIYSHQEVAMLQDAAMKIRPQDGLRPRTHVTLLGLLVCTGMRVSEALSLNAADVDLDAGLLTIRWGKFRRSRLVPLHTSTVHALREYCQFRDDYFRGTISDAFFLNESGTRLSYHHVRGAFSRIRRRVGWTAAPQGRLPRVHDLRHTFAVRFILRCYEENGKIDQKIAVLSTYLGHVNITKTYWYLTAVPELMAIVGKRFERFSLGTAGGEK